MKFSKRGSSVTVHGAVDAGHLIVRIEDSCGGLRDEKIETILRSSPRNDKREAGHGLGLRISKQAVERNGGTLKVEDLPGKGCVFIIDLPIII